MSNEEESSDCRRLPDDPEHASRHPQQCRIRNVQAEDGVEGLEKLDTANPDVIVTDINMPRLDGFGFIEGVRKNDRYRAVPISC